MSQKNVVTLNCEDDVSRLHAYVKRVIQRYQENAERGFRVIFEEPKRSVEQNKRLWAMLNEVASQHKYYGQLRSTQDWKTLFTAALNEEEVVPNIDGTGFVQLWGKASSTSTMSKTKLSDLMELIMEYGTNNGVVFDDQYNEDTT